MHLEFPLAWLLEAYVHRPWFIRFIAHKMKSSSCAARRSKAVQTTILFLVRKWVRYLVGVACDQLALATRDAGG
jgi:hypothetical protein